MMQTLRLDFNRLDSRGRVQIGPEAMRRNIATLALEVIAGERVLVVDDDGNSCEGILEYRATRVGEVPVHDGTLAEVVRLNLDTWRDG